MRNTVMIALAALTIAATGASAAKAGAESTVSLTNQSNAPVWVTLYEMDRTTIMDSFCVKASGTFNEHWDWSGAFFTFGGFFARFEYKQGTSGCTTATIYDSGLGGMYKWPALGASTNINVPPLATGFIEPVTHAN